MSLYSGNGILRGGVLTSYVDAKLNIYKADAIDQRLKIPVKRSSHIKHPEFSCNARTAYQISSATSFQ